MATFPHSLAASVRKLESHSDLAAAGRDAILALPTSAHRFPANRPIVHEGSPASGCWILTTGYAFRSKLTASGARQIVAIHLPGDAVDLQNALLPWADHSVHALTPVEAAFVPTAAVHDLLAAHPGAALALWRDTLVDAAIQREWIVNVGQRSAEARIAHLLCELATRQRAAGLATGEHYELPMTQEALADCTGMTSVHVNRMLQHLRRSKLIEQHGRSLRIEDWQALARVADFEPDYLFVEPSSALQSSDRLNGRTLNPPDRGEPVLIAERHIAMVAT